VAVVEMLLQAGPGTAVVPSSNNLLLPLHRAVQAAADPETVSALLGAAPDSCGVPDKMGNTPLHTAAQFLAGDSGLRIAALLITAASAEVKQMRNLVGRTAAEEAVWRARKRPAQLPLLLEEDPL